MVCSLALRLSPRSGPRLLVGPVAKRLLERAQSPPRLGRGPGSPLHSPRSAPPPSRSQPSHGRAGAAAGGIEDGGLRRPPRVCPASASAATGPNLRYTCELVSCPGAPAPRANSPSEALHPKCGI